MARPKSRILGLSALVAASAVLSATMVVRADCGGPEKAPSVFEDVRGTTFSGTVAEIRSPGPGVTVAWDVEEVYAGGPLPATLEFRSPACDTTLLDPGVRYLFSTSGLPGEPDTADSAAWLLEDGDQVSLWAFGFGRDPRDYPDAFQAIATLEEALAAVAPGHGPGLPPTDTAVTGSSSPSTTLPVLAVVFTLSALLLLYGRRRVRPERRQVA